MHLFRQIRRTEPSFEFTRTVEISCCTALEYGTSHSGIPINAGDPLLSPRPPQLTSTPKMERSCHSSNYGESFPAKRPCFAQSWRGTKLDMSLRCQYRESRFKETLRLQPVLEPATSRICLITPGLTSVSRRLFYLSQNVSSMPVAMKGTPGIPENPGHKLMRPEFRIT